MKIIQMLFLSFIFISIFLLGCTTMEDKDSHIDRIHQVENVNQELKGEEIEPIFFDNNFTKKYGNKKRVVLKNTQTYSLLNNQFWPSMKVTANTVVNVQRAAYYELEDGEYNYYSSNHIDWLEVKIPSFYTQSDMIVWVKASDVTQYTNAEKNFVKAPVTFVSTEQMDNKKCRIEEKKKSQVKLVCTGEDEYWIDEKDIIYPYTEQEEINEYRSSINLSFGKEETQKLVIYFIDLTDETRQTIQPIEILYRKKDFDPVTSVLNEWGLRPFFKYTDAKLTVPTSSDLKLLSINKENDIFIVDFSKEFYDNTDWIMDEQIATLVMTLTQYPNTEGVRILIEGKSRELFDGVPNEVFTREKVEGKYKINPIIRYVGSKS